MKTVIFGICLLIAAIAVLGSGISSLRMDNQARSWATTEGSIISSKCVNYSDLDNGSRYITQVKYQYVVAGKSFEGDRIAFSYSGGWWRKPNQKIADRLSSARKVQVRYDPDNPSKAVLSYGVTGSAILTLFIGTWLLLITVVVSLYVFRSQDRTATITLSWGFNAFKIITRGAGGIVLLVVTGFIIGWVLSFNIDNGIIITQVTS